MRARFTRHGFGIAPWLGVVAALGFGWTRAPGGEPSGVSAALRAHGYAYRNEVLAEGPWSIHLVQADRHHPNLELQTALAGGDRFGLTTLSDHLKAFPREGVRPVAAINGDYYWNRGSLFGDPKGLQIARGELVSGPCDWTCFWIAPGGLAHMTNVVSQFAVTWADGRQTPFGLNQDRPRDAAVLYTAACGATTPTHLVGGLDLVLERAGNGPWLPLSAGQTYAVRVREARKSGGTPLTRDVLVLSLGSRLLTQVPALAPGVTLELSTATAPSLLGVQTALGGGPALVREGKALKRNEAKVRHPRAALGWNDAYWFLIEVDGRQLGVSVGMTDSELANYCVRLGCREAMSLDGGGSATCWVLGQVMNNPSEGHERLMANALVLVKRTKP